MDDKTQAESILKDGAKALKPDAAGPWKFGDLWLFTKEEYEELVELKRVVQRYLADPKPRRPLCIAVFGPPGSGKSVGVKQIVKALNGAKQPAPLQLTELNLTQLSGTDELSGIIRPVEGKAMPVFFVDEFDAALDGNPFGWLSWFLAPMQDGKIWVGGASWSLNRAIYIFAGGTASRLEDFGKANQARFRAAKGPDFVSRLKGYLNIRGPNDVRMTASRRAVLLHRFLQDRGRLTLDPRLQANLLAAGRYRHGARSLESIIDLAASNAAKAKKTELTHKLLPADHLLALHVDRGPLDPQVLGGLIGLSAGGDPDSVPEHTRKGIEASIRAIATTVWKDGGAILYGGKLVQGLTGVLQDALNGLPQRLSQNPNAVAGSRITMFTRENTRRAGLLDAVELVHVSSAGLPGAPDPLHKAAVWARQRWQMSCRGVARVLLWGRLESGEGRRMPGLLEEAVYALAMGQPLYVVGAFGGCAQLLGDLLGLSDAQANPASLPPPVTPELSDPAILLAHRHYFQAPGAPKLPLTLAEAVAFVAGHAFGGPAWPHNGLSIEENRALFVETDPGEIARKIQTGLHRRFA